MTSAMRVLHEQYFHLKTITFSNTESKIGLNLELSIFSTNED
jgi:hypothetical protein